MVTIRKDAPRRIDAYIGKAPEFARPICRRLRELVHEADPGIVEDWKWGPNFNKDGMVCGIGAFKEHVTLTFFKGALMGDARGLFNQGFDNEYTRSVKFRTFEEIDAVAVRAYVREAVLLNGTGAKIPRKKPEAEVPADLAAAFGETPGARAFFDGLTPGYRREFVTWITDAKRAPTREKRIRETVAKCARGERLNDRYRGC